MAWWMAAAALIGGAAQAWGGSQAADAGKDAAKQNTALARENRNIILGMNEPNRALGYGATSDLATLYGYRIPEYTPLNRLGNPSVTGGANPAAAGTYAPGTATWSGTGEIIKVGGKRNSQGFVKDMGNSVLGGLSPWSSNVTRLGGYIDPVAGTVSVRHKKNQRNLDAQATAYLRGDPGAELNGRKWKKLRRAIDAMHSQGWKWSNTPDAPTAGVIQPGQGAGQGTSADGTSGNFSRFFTSPDYQFRLNEGAKVLQNSAAARGNLFSGATGKALTDWGQQAASQEYGNYFERLMRMAGMGGNATNNNASAVTNAGNQMIASNNQAAMSRASAYGNTADAINNTLQNFYYAYRRGA